MTRAIAGTTLSLLLLGLAGCASVPQVEQRLATMEFHANMYVVQAGDTFESVAWRYKLEPAELARLNPGQSANLKPGTRINVRPGTTLSDNLRNRQSLQALAQGKTQPGPARPALEPSYNAQASQSAPGLAVPDPHRLSGPAVRDEVTVARVESQEAIRREPAAQMPFPDDGVTEIQASARTDAQLLGGTRPRNNGWERVPQRDSRSVNNPWPREEVIEDDLPLERLAVNEHGSNFPQAQSRTVMPQSIAGRWVWPTRGEVARGFEPARIGGQGVDIAGVPGQDVRAAKSGKVVYSGRDLSGGGNLVIVQHDKNLMTTYSHADKLFVSEDDLVKAGDPIASLGWNSKRESVLRFEVRRDGKPLNPLNFLPGS